MIGRHCPPLLHGRSRARLPDYGRLWRIQERQVLVFCFFKIFSICIFKERSWLISSGTLVRSVSRVLNGWRTTSRTRSWSPSTSSTSNRTSAKVPPQSLLSSFHSATKFSAIRFLESSCQIFLFARRLGRLQGARYPGLPCNAQHGHGEVLHPHRDLVRHKLYRISVLS